MWLLMVAAAWAATPAEQAWDRLAHGDAEAAYALTHAQWGQDPAVAWVRIEAEKRLFDPRQAAATCTRLMSQIRGPWADRAALAKTCGWQFVQTRTARTLAIQCFDVALAIDEWDQDARSGRAQARSMEPLPTKRWAPPPPEGQMRARRKRDIKYLAKYLWPESGGVTASGEWTSLPDSKSAQVREAVQLDLFLRPHEHVIAAWRGSQWVTPSSDPSPARPTSHQLHGGYRLTFWDRTPLQLDGTWIVGKGRDEAAVRFRIEQVGLGVWSADLATVVSPWGTHGALRAGWNVTFDGLATVDLAVEGQAGAGAPRVLARLGLAREVKRVEFRVDGQWGRAARPIDETFLVTDLPGIEGSGVALSVKGKLAKRWYVTSEVGAKRLHDVTSPLTSSEAITASQVGLDIQWRW